MRRCARPWRSGSASAKGTGREWRPVLSLPPEMNSESGGKRSPTPQQQDLRVVGVATGLGCSIVVTFLVCIVGGLVIDRRFDTAPVWTLIGLALGLAAAGYQLWELVRLGSNVEQAGPVSRQLSRLPFSRAKREASPHGARPQPVQDEE
ncbi:MAG: AtpZ/AtpI family protein [Thermomicrobiales bacterium]